MIHRLRPSEIEKVIGASGHRQLRQAAGLVSAPGFIGGNNINDRLSYDLNAREAVLRIIVTKKPISSQEITDWTR